MEKKRLKKKITENQTSSDAFDEQDTAEMYQLKQKNRFLKDTIRTQRNQFAKLYIELNNLQEKEDEHEKKIEAYNKLDRYAKTMRESNKKVKNFW